MLMLVKERDAFLGFLALALRIANSSFLISEVRSTLGYGEPLLGGVVGCHDISGSA